LRQITGLGRQIDPGHQRVGSAGAGGHLAHVMVAKRPRYSAAVIQNIASRAGG
jgi:hypothetical protein